MKVILSIKPEYASKILDGTKKYEFRKAAFTCSDVSCVVIYATKPVGKLVGEFDISSVDVDEPKSLWRRTKEFAGVKKSFFDQYFKDRARGVAIGVGEVRKYATPLDLNSLGENLTAPQSYRYVPAEHPQLELLQA